MSELRNPDTSRKAGLTQMELAARIESGRGAPKWSTIERYARAVGARPVVRLLQAAE